MAISTWEPNQQPPQDNSLLSAEFLERAAKISQQNQLEQLEQLFDATEQASYSAVMRHSQQQWTSAVDTLDCATIYHVMRFLTVAEMTFSEWEVGAQSPVIWLNKLLKRRGEPLQKDQVLWIKSNTRNRYLPNGAVL